jgi:hypothetical protein
MNSPAWPWVLEQGYGMGGGDVEGVVAGVVESFFRRGIRRSALASLRIVW